MSDDDAWAGARVASWLRRAADLERQLEPVSDVLFAAADLRPGESVLDVGCGAGPTTRRAAALVGTGRVTGLDISPDMLAAAAQEPGGEAIEWLRADAVSWQPQAHWDVILSRFGVMFFSDPAAAFATLARAARPGGRLVMAVWSRRDESAFFAVPLRAAAAALRVAELPADDEGPFSLADEDLVRRVLTAAGWTDVRIAERALTLPFNAGPREAAAASLDLGPTRWLTAELGDADRERVIAVVADALGEHLDAAGHVRLAASVRVVTARAAG